MGLRCIRNKNLPTRMNLCVVQRVELPPIEIVQQHGGVVRRFWVDGDDRRGSGASSGRDEDHRAVIRPRAPVRHLDGVREVDLEDAQA